MDTFKDIVEKDVDELKSLALETRELLRTIRFDRSTKEVKDNRLQRNTRRYLAWLLTAIHSKEK